MLADSVCRTAEKTRGQVVAGQLSTNWEAHRRRQFSLRALLEVLTLSACVFAAIHIHSLLMFALAFAAAAILSIRAPDWRMRVSLVMLFSGVSVILLGICAILWALYLAAEALGGSGWPEMLLFFGPSLVLVGIFYGAFGVLHLVITVGCSE